MYRIVEAFRSVDTYGTGDQQRVPVFQIMRDWTPEELSTRNYSPEVIEKGCLVDKVSVREVAECYVEKMNAPVRDFLPNVVVVDKFIWLPVSEKAKEIFSSGTFELYVLHTDGSESLVESHAQINDALECGLTIAIEVGYLESVE